MDDGSTTVEKYEYDGTGRRIQIFSNFDGNAGTVEDDYHSGQQVVETRDERGVSAVPVLLVAALHRRPDPPRHVQQAGKISQAERIFYLGDANYNVTGLVKYKFRAAQWQVVERYTYAPYGVVTVSQRDWTDARVLRQSPTPSSTPAARSIC